MKLPGGKNAMSIDPRSGRHYANERFEIWRAAAMTQILNQRPAGPAIFVPCRVKVDYTPGDLIGRDVPGMMDALWHVLERAKIIVNDKLLEDVQWNRHDLDRENPVTAIEIVEK